MKKVNKVYLKKKLEKSKQNKLTIIKSNSQTNVRYMGTDPCTEHTFYRRNTT
tara:strand:- start:3377 stop:3532 length:156 start_codon:yes stop_codon:yes gene_type:complete